MKKVDIYKFLIWQGYNNEVAWELAADYMRTLNLVDHVSTMVRLFMRDGSYKDYKIEREDLAANYIASAMAMSKSQKRSDSRFVVGGKIL